MATPVWFITGTTSGFGKQIAVEALGRGHKVIATARNSTKLAELKSKGAHVMDFDVTADEPTLAAKLDEAAAVYGGRLTHVVNTAGYILAGAVEEASQQEVYDEFNTNVFGICNVLRAAAPHLRSAAAGDVTRQQHQPTYVTFGSVGSYHSSPGIAHYCSTKATVSSLSEGLAGEMKPFGVAVCCVEPGYTRTEFLQKVGGKERRVVARRELDLYKTGPVQQTKDAMEAVSGKQPGDVEKMARVIVDVLTKEGVAKGREIPVRLPLGSDTIETVRKTAVDYMTLVEEWEDVARLTDYESSF
ncbi:hypothetical protein GE09DRAFT_1156191 [Coniochaeta sp. 2T2.1]|nr:hypothetical protein GE09DRAFT_1156191 [Coniochaeta sp. 2T2.1]